MNLQVFQSLTEYLDVYYLVYIMINIMHHVSVVMILCYVLIVLNHCIIFLFSVFYLDYINSRGFLRNKSSSKRKKQNIWTPARV